MGILSWVLFGIAAGVAARYLLPAGERIGLFWTLVVGVAGAGIGGYVASELVGNGETDSFELAPFLIAAATSVLLLLAWDRIDRALPGREPGKPGEHWRDRLTK
jgi:uncharacterized membrane protein YeaQ/YmgE (transglycosylase-associated protein family)